MKKLFAVFLALAMVFSIVPSFALSDCFYETNFDWSCNTYDLNCGRGTIEVVPFIVSNGGCNEYDIQPSECAGAVEGEHIFFALKLTVDANPNARATSDPSKPQTAYWWDSTWEPDPEDENDPGETAVVVTYKNITYIDEINTPVRTDIIPINSTHNTEIDWTADEPISYYYWWWIDMWIKAEKFEKLPSIVTQAFAAPNSDGIGVEVCAELYSKHNGVGEWYYRNLKVDTSTPGMFIVENGIDRLEYTIADDNSKSLNCTSADFLTEVSKVFNMSDCIFSTCLTAENIKNNFGWDTNGKLKDCFTWSPNAVATIAP